VTLRSNLPPLYPILDAALLPPGRLERQEAIAQLVCQLFAAGATLLQYRNKQGNDEQVLEDARSIRAAAGPAPTLILNDRVHLVRAAGFDGAHVGQSDLSAEEARNILGPDAVLGISTHDCRQVADAGKAPVDYIAIGPVFATASKENPDPVVGLEGVAAARRLTGKPLVAIGGITVANARAVIDAGADSVAVISAIFRNGPALPGVRKNVEDFLSIFM
jgi:thiamine-phosphate pyrophosphorylase